MKQGETDATLRRIGPLRVVDTLGNALTGAFGGTVEIMVAGGAFGAAAGSVVEIGAGYYYYQGTLGDSSTRPWVAVRLSGTCQEIVFREDVTTGPAGGVISPGETDTLLKRVGPFHAIDGSGNPITTTVGITVEVSVNGAAWAAASGALTLNENGYPFYIASDAEVAAGGWVAVKLTGTAQEFVFREYIGVGGVTTPVLTVLTTFAVTFKEARLQLWQAELADWPSGTDMVVIVKYAERNEAITARDADGNWCWPFDVVEDNIVDLVSDPVTVQLRPRGGWLPSDAEIQIAAAVMAQE